MRRKSQNRTLMPIPARLAVTGESTSMAGRAGIARRSAECVVLLSFFVVSGEGASVLPKRFSAHMTSIVHDPVHCADVRRDHSIHPERLWVGRSCGGEALQYLEAVAGMLSRQPHRLGVRGFQRRVFDSRVRSANAEDVVVCFHGKTEEGEGE
jgi:hypothetical protein